MRFSAHLFKLACTQLAAVMLLVQPLLHAPCRLCVAEELSPKGCGAVLSLPEASATDCHCCGHAKEGSQFDVQSPPVGKAPWAAVEGDQALPFDCPMSCTCTTGEAPALVAQVFSLGNGKLARANSTPVLGSLRVQSEPARPPLSLADWPARDSLDFCALICRFTT